jgi:homoserine O-succinyltransferase
MFVKKKNSLLVFFQGHPEYEANTLFLEYRRDIGRYLRGENTRYPEMPESYFNEDGSAALSELQRRALIDRPADLLADFPMSLVEKGIRKTWHSVAVSIYGNWLTYLYAQKRKRVKQALNAITRSAETESSSAVAAHQ